MAGIVKKVERARVAVVALLLGKEEEEEGE